MSKRKNSENNPKSKTHKSGQLEVQGAAERQALAPAVRPVLAPEARSPVNYVRPVARSSREEREAEALKAQEAVSRKAREAQENDNARGRSPSPARTEPKSEFSFKKLLWRLGLGTAAVTAPYTFTYNKLNSYPRVPTSDLTSEIERNIQIAHRPSIDRHHSNQKTKGALLNEKALILDEIDKTDDEGKEADLFKLIDKIDQRISEIDLFNPNATGYDLMESPYPLHHGFFYHQNGTLAQDGHQMDALSVQPQLMSANGTVIDEGLNVAFNNLSSSLGNTTVSYLFSGKKDNWVVHDPNALVYKEGMVFISNLSKANAFPLSRKMPASEICKLLKKIFVKLGAENVTDVIRCVNDSIELKGRDGNFTKLNLTDEQGCIEDLHEWLNILFQGYPNRAITFVHLMTAMIGFLVFHIVLKPVVFLGSRYLAKYYKTFFKILSTKNDGGSRKKKRGGSRKMLARAAKNKSHVSWSKSTRAKTHKNNRLLKECNLRL